jgi:predicted ATP-grasp superfamily ATP-dependent carboligase
MATVNWEQRPQLRRPAMICAFKGWNDAAESASTALRFLATRWDAERFAAIDPDDFFDFQVARPTVTLTEGRTRKITWPEHVFWSARAGSADRDIVFLSGNEPNLRWRGFCETVIDVANQLDVELVVTLGSLLADVPHTRPVQITGIAGDPEMVARLNFTQTRYEGPTGITGVLHHACAAAEIKSAGLWAPVPHYVATVPSPKASLALIERVQMLLDVEVDTAELEQATEEYEQRLDAAVASEPDVKLLVERLEAQADETEEDDDAPLGDLPSGDSIASEFQRFLRDQGEQRE